MAPTPLAKSGNTRNDGKAAKSRRPTDSNQASSSSRSRQRPGAACHECRGRKLRCDRKQPICGACESSSLTCQYTTVLAPRGPKPGYLKDLQERLASLEYVLCQITQQPTTWLSQPSPSLEFPVLQDVSHDPLSPFPPSSAAPAWTALELGQNTAMSLDGFDLEALSPASLTPDRRASIATVSTFTCPDTPTGSSSPTQSILDQVYWHKIHPLVPILHYRRYMSWSSRTDKSITKECLQYCMWTIAASAATEYDHGFTDGLYRCALQRMQRIEAACTDRVTSTDGPDDLEQVQALLLLSLYELKHVDFRRGWITAGRAFSLIQLSFTQNLPSWAPNLALTTDWIDVDEKRRTFWLAFCLDCFISLRNNSPCTFGDHMTVPIPDSDDDFQKGNVAIPVYLNEILDNPSFQLQRPFPIFNEHILLASLCSDVISHRSKSLSEESHCTEPDTFWARHQQLVDSLTQHVQAFVMGGRVKAHNADSTRLFLGTMWITLILYHHRTLTMFLAPLGSECVAPDCTEKASIAAQHLTVLMYNLLELNGRELHPLTLVPLKLCNELLDPWPDLASLFSNQLCSIIEAIGDVFEMNQKESEIKSVGNIENMTCADSILERFLFCDV
ncbi:fungal-specific transcription factor domain-containing protein [Diaporthe sp. PMI_573]|nr:fungal-specific transcription factor domain-containing protein [Diaporthaceae sp. PMI_573]